MTKELIFDMDGTIADLYGYPDWLARLRSEDPRPYAEAKPMYDMDTLVILLKLLKAVGFEVAVVSWGSKEASRDYNRETKRAKKSWLDTFDFPYDRLHVVKYGTPKANYIRNDLSILLDDNKDVREAFVNSNRGKYKQAVDVTTRSIVYYLADLLLEELERREKEE